MSSASPQACMESFVAALVRKDIDAALPLLTDDVALFYSNGSAIWGKAAFTAAITANWKQLDRYESPSPMPNLYSSGAGGWAVITDAVHLPSTAAERRARHAPSAQTFRSARDRTRRRIADTVPLEWLARERMLSACQQSWATPIHARRNTGVKWCLLSPVHCDVVTDVKSRQVFADNGGPL